MGSLTSLMNIQSPILADLVFDGVFSPKTDLSACVLQATSAGESDPTAPPSWDVKKNVVRNDKCHRGSHLPFPQNTALLYASLADSH